MNLTKISILLLMIFAYAVSVLHSLVGHVHHDALDHEYSCQHNQQLSSPSNFKDNCDDNFYGLLSCLLAQIHHDENSQDVVKSIQYKLTHSIVQSFDVVSFLFQEYLNIEQTEEKVPSFLYQKLKQQLTYTDVTLRGPPNSVSFLR